MPSETLVRWCGLALAAGGVCLALFALTHPISASGGVDLNNRGPQFIVSHTFHFVGATLVQFGLIGIFARQMREAGRLGAAAFVLAFVGTVTFGVLGAVAAYVAPAYPLLLSDRDPLQPPNPLGFVFPVFGFTFIAGWALQAVAVVKAGILPRWSALPTILGVGPFGLGFLLPWVIGAAGGLLFGSGLAWLGYAVYRGPRVATARRPANG